LKKASEKSHLFPIFKFLAVQNPLLEMSPVSIKTTAPKRRRKRGVILTPSGLARFQAAKTEAEYAKNQGQRYTLESLSELTGVGLDTLTKVLNCETRVDKQTLKYCFRAFDLVLEPSDYYRPKDTAVPAPNAVKADTTNRLPSVASFDPPPPGGQLPLDSPIYISRAKAEASSFRAIDQPGALIRIRGARRMGKTSLMARISQQARQRGYQPVFISFQLADSPILQDIDQLLQWFCASVGLGMGVAPALATYWDTLFGSKVSCKIYFEQYLLTNTDQPIVLILDDVERLFRYVEVADEFFGLLRTWYEDAKTTDTWKQVRMVIAQSSEVYIPLNINKSPFNVGLAVALPPLAATDVQALAAAYELAWPAEAATELCALIEGQPYLAHVAVDRIWRNETSLPDMLADPIGCQIFSPYLQHQLHQVQQQPQLANVLKQVLENQFSMPSSLQDVHQLQSMGLLVWEDSGPRLACDLFTRYFSRQAGFAS